jgi:hypothetical protein
MRIGLEIGLAFFLAMLATAVGYDIKRNWGQSEPTLEFDPLLFWKVFLYGGSFMFLSGRIPLLSARLVAPDRIRWAYDSMLVRCTEHVR